MNPLWLFFIFFATTNSFMTFPRLSLIPEWETSFNDHEDFVANDLDVNTFYYEQPLDHFNYLPESFTTFQQRYFINFKYWGGANSSAPIFVFFGGEAPIDDMPKTIGFMIDNADFFNALLVYIEHRYYGESVPFGSWEEATKNASTMGYFNSAQAIADYAEVILHIKETLHAKMSPVIIIGGSYSGMLATWFRLKYPHLAIGALASSAPILYFDDITPQSGYYDVVTRDFREASQTCYETIKKSWSEIDRIASQPNGLSILSQLFNFCYPLKDSTKLKSYLERLYSYTAQFNAPPKYPVSVLCGTIDEISNGSGILHKIGAGITASWGNDTCKGNGPTFASVQTNVGWSWQTCTDIVIPLGKGNDTMFQPAPFDLELYAEDCKERYGVPPRPHWVTTYYGGHDIKLVLQRFGSNIIFSNGLRDPYSSGGVLDNISNSIVAIHTVKGSHCLDILPASKSDPEWLIEQRKKEIKIIKEWINQYNADFGVYSSKASQKYSVTYSSCIMTAWLAWWILYRLDWDMLV